MCDFAHVPLHSFFFSSSVRPDPSVLGLCRNLGPDAQSVFTSFSFFSSSSPVPAMTHSCCLCRYEDLKQQLMAAQNLAEQEGDQQELARAAAAVARLTFPASGPADTPPRTPLVPPCCRRPVCTYGATVLTWPMACMLCKSVLLAVAPCLCTAE